MGGGGGGVLSLQVLDADCAVRDASLGILLLAPRNGLGDDRGGSSFRINGCWGCFVGEEDE